MIVNPQLFNYRLIIGSLIVAITVLGVYSFNNYQSITSHQQFIEQEKKLVESELSQMISRYDDISVTNNLMASQLEDAKQDTKIALDSLRLLHSDLTVVSKFKQQVLNLKSRNKSLFNDLESSNETNKGLESEKMLAHNELEKQRSLNSILLEENKNLNKNLEEAALLTANSFKAKAYKSIIGKKVATKKATSTESIEVCFVLAKNVLTEQGEKEIYIQIVNPKNNVVVDKGAVHFGDSSLIYSTKEVIDYQNTDIDICIDVKADEDDQPLVKGHYFINVFHNNQKLGSTQVKLN